MGSWNGTCGLSQMPIREGDRVLLFPLIKDKHAKNGGVGFSYSHNQYAPISIPLLGVYNDYGSIKGEIKNGAFLFTLLQEAVGGEEGAILSYNKEKYERQKAINSTFTGTPKDVEELIDVYLRDPVYAGTGYMLVLEEVYQKVIDEVATREKSRVKKPLREHYMEGAVQFLTEVNAILQIPLETLRKEQAQLRESRDDESDAYYEKWETVRNQLSVHYGVYKDAFTTNDFVDYFSELGKSNFMFNKLLLQQLVKASTEEQAVLMSDYVDLILFNTVMELTRKLWTPQAGAGSQGNELYLHKIIAESVIEREQKEIDDWFEENMAETEEDIQWGRNSTKESIW